MYQRIGNAAYKADLSNTVLIADYLGNPETAFKSIHVAGTNGKGSSSHMLASIFQEAGYKVGLYTSPHLNDFRERIKINGEMIPKSSVSSFINKHKSFFEEHQLSFFEMTVGLAFNYFMEESVDIAIIEVGLGGRLDSTNIITPELSVITNIGLDHTQYLGINLADIAKEKAGIIKPGVPVIIGETIPETKAVFLNIAAAKNAPISFVNTEMNDVYTSDLKGEYQKRNIKAVVLAINLLRNSGWTISEEALVGGLSRVVANTGLMGRWQVLGNQPRVICDAAHNKEGLELVMNQLAVEKYSKLHIVLGVVNDKKLESILNLFPEAARYYFCRPDILRGMDAVTLMMKAKEFGLIGDSYDSVSNAYKLALQNASKDDLIFIGGSTFVVAEVL
jgi:dihydrofolate synthase/folylpolyglutamate synthase